MKTAKPELAAQQLQQRIELELAEFAQQLRANGDVAPARIARLEGAIGAGIDSGVLVAEEIVERVRELLPDQCLVQLLPAAEFCRVRLQLWQRRAPVYPSAPE